MRIFWRLNIEISLRGHTGPWKVKCFQFPSTWPLENGILMYTVFFRTDAKCQLFSAIEFPWIFFVADLIIEKSFRPKADSRKSVILRPPFVGKQCFYPEVAQVTPSSCAREGFFRNGRGGLLGSEAGLICQLPPFERVQNIFKLVLHFLAGSCAISLHPCYTCLGHFFQVAGDS